MSYYLLKNFDNKKQECSLVFYLGYAGDLGAKSVALDSGSVRPAISLVKGTLISGGDGTSTNPYVVQ